MLGYIHWDADTLSDSVPLTAGVVRTKMKQYWHYCVTAFVFYDNNYNTSLFSYLLLDTPCCALRIVP